MNFTSFLICLTWIFCLASAADKPALTGFTVERRDETTTTSSTTASPTLVWITTTTGGNPATIQVTYKQSFRSFYTEVAVPSSGSIGLGTISGTIGTIRTYRTLTVSDSATATANADVN